MKASDRVLKCGGGAGKQAAVGEIGREAGREALVKRLR